jgi:predicted PurR-regulated permease PerM
MIAVGVPAAGIWAVAVMVLAIAQLPALIVLLPIILYVFSVESTTVAIVFAIWSILVGISDAFLKPVLLGRGVDVPTLVILLGAIGGMITSGLLGLFVGAVVLAIGYKLLLLWLSTGDEPAQQVEPAPPEKPASPGAA